MGDRREQSSAMTLSSVAQNDRYLRALDIEGAGGSAIGVSGYIFSPGDGGELARLGDALGGNTSVTTICISFYDASLADAMRGNKAFYEGLRRNSSINRMYIEQGNLGDAICGELLGEFVANNVNLTSLLLKRCRLTGGVRALASAVNTCRNLKYITISRGDGEAVPFDDSIMQEMVSTRMLPQLNEVSIVGLKLGIAGFHALANLLQDPQCGLTRIELAFVLDQSVDGRYSEILADSLRSNGRLKNLDLQGFHVTEDGWEAFSTALCDTSDVNSTYLSNHTLTEIHGLDNMPDDLGLGVARLLRMNEEGPDEKRIAMMKSLLNHYLDMEPLLEWELKALPLAIGWFEKAATLILSAERRDFAAFSNQLARVNVDVDAEKLSAIYQFTRSLPLLFVPSKKCASKRKMGDISE